MSLELYLLCVLASALLVATPGPNVAGRACTAVSGRAQELAGRASGAILLGGAAVLLAASRR